MMREPDSKVSVSALPEKNSAAKLPMMVPEFVTSAAVLARIPRSPPEIVPEFVTLAVPA